MGVQAIGGQASKACATDAYLNLADPCGATRLLIDAQS